MQAGVRLGAVVGGRPTYVPPCQIQKCQANEECWTCRLLGVAISLIVADGAGEGFDEQAITPLEKTVDVSNQHQPSTSPFSKKRMIHTDALVSDHLTEMSMQHCPP
jgi:hypothetical protein